MQDKVNSANPVPKIRVSRFGLGFPAMATGKLPADWESLQNLPEPRMFLPGAASNL
jgi:hypothetical protein